MRLKTRTPFVYGEYMVGLDEKVLLTNEDGVEFYGDVIRVKIDTNSLLTVQAQSVTSTAYRDLTSDCQKEILDALDIAYEEKHRALVLKNTLHLVM